MLGSLVALAVGAAAVSLVAGCGTYLFIRFTQQRRKPPADSERRRPDKR